MNRNKIMAFKTTEEERQKIIQRAEEVGLTPASYCRVMALATVNKHIQK